MSNAIELQTHGPVRVIRPGLLERIKITNGIRSDEALARIMGISRPTLQRYKNGDEPSLRSIALLADTFGLALGEVVVAPTPVEEATS